MPCHDVYPREPELIQIVNAALADAFKKSGQWLACKPGCSQCCHGVFAINQLDARRLRRGLAELEAQDPERAAVLRKRALETVARLSEDYPGDPVSGVLDEDDTDEAAKRWDDFANEEPCPALDPATGKCELYEFRPVICRTFGPAMKTDGDLGHCELCFVGASDEEVAAHEMSPDPNNLEATLVEELQKATGESGETIIAFALVQG
jgi:Fe-S-cluster containining protein